MRAHKTPHNQPQSSSAHPVEPLLTREDTAAALSICLRAVDERIACGDLEVVTIGRSVRIRPCALELFIEARATRRAPHLARRKATKSITATTGGEE